MKKRDLPLLYKTPLSWAKSALEEPVTLLNDHAHLERKAASNALELISRWPQTDPTPLWVATLIGVAKDEIEHFNIVVRLLAKRGSTLTRMHRSTYASHLRNLVRLGRGKEELLDRLLVSALIEIRSCERFSLLSEAAEDLVLKKLYRSLWASEHGHYTVFLELGREVCPAKTVNARWDELLRREAEIIEHEPPGARMHSGVGELDH